MAESSEISPREPPELSLREPPVLSPREPPELSPRERPELSPRDPSEPSPRKVSFDAAPDYQSEQSSPRDVPRLELDRRQKQVQSFVTSHGLSVKGLTNPESDSDSDSDAEEEEEQEEEEQEQAVSPWALVGKDWTHGLRSERSATQKLGRRIGRSKAFAIASVIGIVGNAMFTGFFIDAKLKFQRGLLDSLQAYVIIESCFLSFFLFELLIRAVNHAQWQLWQDALLMLDVVVIVIPAIEIWILMPLGANSSDYLISGIGSCRILRLARGIMVLARIKAFKPLYLAVAGMWKSSSLLLASLLFMASVTFTASVTLCLLIGPSNSNHESFPPVISARFGSVSRSFLTLAEALLGGVEWGPTLVYPLLYGSRPAVIAGIILLVFVVVGNVILLNITAGMFVQQVHIQTQMHTSYKLDPDILEASAELLADVIDTFQKMDENGDGTLTWKEFASGIAHHVDVLGDLGIGLAEAKQTFNEIDLDQSGIVSIDEFLGGLQDSMAYKAVEVLIMENQQTRLLTVVRKHAKRSQKQLKQVVHDIQDWTDMLSEAVQETQVLPQILGDRLLSQSQRVIQKMPDILPKKGGDTWQEAAWKLSSTPDSSPRAPDKSGLGKGGDFLVNAWNQTLETAARAEIRALARSGNGTHSIL